MNKENGNISIHTENIFPIIKKWLYSDKDIFVRELISNGCDAISKLKRLQGIGEAKLEENQNFYIKVLINEENKTVKFIDNGIGMTAEEVKKYINQVAFSGAEDFLEKYKGKMDESNEIIGHFGLGFYSAFMVAEKVQIDTKSYQEESEAVKWICAGGTEYEMEVSDKAERGTTITLYLNEDEKDFLKEYDLREIITKYCSFMPVEITLENEIKEVKENEENVVEVKPLNNTHPLWLKKPEDCTDEEYKEFYREVFNDFNEPLFWIHLHVDYPFNLKGILFFPKLKHEFESIEGQIKLYNNQVYVADNIKEVIPEFLMLLKGVIDCADLPLNVSRSFLQKDSNVVKISQHITKKVADKLLELHKNDKDKYESFWEDINPFIKYGCLREIKFYEKVKDILIYKTTNDKYETLKDYLKNNNEKHENKVFYVNDEKQQAQYIKLFKDHGMEAIILGTVIDKHFITFLEMQESGIKFNRIDSDLSDSLKTGDTNEEEHKDLKETLGKLFKAAVNNNALKVQIEALKTQELPAMILLSEQSRRMQEMSQIYGGGMDIKNLFPNEETLVVNRNNQLVAKLIELNEKETDQEDVNMICEQIYDLALMSHKQLDSEAMAKFIARSNTLLTKFANVK